MLLRYVLLGISRELRLPFKWWWIVYSDVSKNQCNVNADFFRFEFYNALERVILNSRDNWIS